MSANLRPWDDDGALAQGLHWRVFQEADILEIVPMHSFNFLPAPGE
jgi:hypothetical protein